MFNIFSAILYGYSLSVLTISDQVISTTTLPEVIGIDGADLYQARDILRRFFARERHPNCYRVLFSREQGHLTVSFVPRAPRAIVVQEGEPNRTIEPRCGRSIGYVLDGRGRVIRRFYLH